MTVPQRSPCYAPLHSFHSFIQYNIFQETRNSPAMACKPPAKTPPVMAPVIAATVAAAGRDVACLARFALWLVWMLLTRTGWFGGEETLGLAAKEGALRWRRDSDCCDGGAKAWATFRATSTSRADVILCVAFMMIAVFESEMKWNNEIMKQWNIDFPNSEEMRPRRINLLLFLEPPVDKPCSGKGKQRANKDKWEWCPWSTASHCPVTTSGQVQVQGKGTTTRCLLGSSLWLPEAREKVRGVSQCVR